MPTAPTAYPFIYSKHRKLINFALMTTIILIYSLILTNSIFTADADIYWELGRNVFVKDGHFDFLSYNAPYKGYALPLIYYLIIKAASIFQINEIRLFLIISAIFFSICISFLMPATFEKFLGKKISLMQNLIFCYIFLYFWRGSVLIPMTDFPAFFLLVLALYFLISTNQFAERRSCISLMAGGFCIGLSAIIRPSYQIALLLYFIYAAYSLLRYNKLSVASLKNIFIVLAGISLALGPQYAINRHVLGINNPFNQTQYGWRYYPGKQPSQSQYLLQLARGIYNRDWSTVDNHGSIIILNENIGPMPGSSPTCPMLTSYSDYLRLLKKYPMDFVSIYFRHLFQGLDTMSTNPYTIEVKNRIIFSFTNYSLWFMVLLFCWHRKYFFMDIEKILFLSVILSPAILSIPAIPETRLYISFYMLAYATITYTDLLVIIKNNSRILLGTYLLAYVIFVIACFSFSTTCFPYLLHVDFVY
jgi:hypothetical protein